MAQRTCSVDGCEQESRCRGWCLKHYGRWRRTGDPLLTKKTPNGDLLRYFDQHLHDVTDDCKLWPYSVVRGGYGILYLDGKQERVHILACIAAHGPRPDGMEAAHGPCHNPRCWNGAHLRWATRQENNDDRRRDGTDAATITGKLSEVDVLAIRDRISRGDGTFQEIAADFSVSRACIWLLNAGRTYAHIK